MVLFHNDDYPIKLSFTPTEKDLIKMTGVDKDKNDINRK